MPDRDGAPTLHALLIGVDCYLPNRLPGGGSYRSLSGCARDVHHVEAFLKQRLALPDDRVARLTATTGADGRPTEPAERWPTYANMVAAFRQLTDRAAPGEQVYIHYSGHGGRATTLFPDLKGAQGLDESLVPTDIGDPGCRYLRDVELAHLLQAMVDKGLLVTIVLDSCHSGGATRGEARAVPRGIAAVDTGPRPTDSLVAPPADLAATWRRQAETAGGATRSLASGGGWLPEPRGYVLLAACRPSESAFEFPFDGVESNGALTYWLLDALRDLGPQLTWKTLRDRLVAKVHSQFDRQTPLLQGEGNRVVFGAREVPPQFAVTVLEVDPTGERLRLNAGQAHGVGKGARFAVYPAGVANLTDANLRQALVEVAERGAVDAWAVVTDALKPGQPIAQGAQAVLLEPGAVVLRRQVRLVERPDLPAGVAQAAALAPLAAALVEAGAGWVVAAADTDAVDFQVALSDDGHHYEIWDPAGVPLPNLRPALALSDPGAPAAVVRRLVHLAKYRNVQQLANHDQQSPLRGRLELDLLGWQSDYEPGDPRRPQPFDPGRAALAPGRWLFLRIKNGLPPIAGNPSGNVLNVTVLDLRPDWSVAQIYPVASASLEPLDPGQELVLDLRADLPPDYAAGTDTLKVFGTLGTSDFHWLALPALDQPIPTRSSTRSAEPRDPLNNLLAALAADAPATRSVELGIRPSVTWTVGAVEVRVERGA